MNNPVPEGDPSNNNSAPIKSEEPQGPDHGTIYMPVKTENPKAPEILDHFKRGYGERAEFRERDTEQHNPAGFDRNATSAPDDKKEHVAASPSQQQPAPSSGSYYGPASPGPMDNHNRKTYDDDKQYSRSNYNHTYSKYDDKQYTRSYVDDRYNRTSNYKGSTGFSMEEVVDRLCHPRSNIYEEMDEARRSSPESFSSGRAITAILSQLGRRRQMNVAMQVWHWMERAEGINRNVFHYNALINVCEKIKDWKRALDLLRQMDEEGVAKNEITYSSAISACEKGGK
jgi:pentatricopeptide repeat protein